MDRNSFLVWWLLAVPIVLAIVDRMMMSGSTSASAAPNGMTRLDSSRPVVAPNAYPTTPRTA